MADNSENQGNTAVAELPNNIRVEDLGPATKKVWVEIPKEKVAAKLAEQFKELREEAHIPGFRKGHAPEKLLRKKFSDDIKDQVRRSLISESYEQAITSNSLQVLGEPEFDNIDQVKIIDDSPLNYSFSVEIQPDIKLPDLKGIKVRKPKIEVTEDHINQAMTNLREQQGTMVPVEDRGIAARDYITADVVLKAPDTQNYIENRDARIHVRPGSLFGVQIDDLDKQLEGIKAGEEKHVIVDVPENSPAQNLRGKKIHIHFTVKDIKKIEPVEIDDEFLESLGFKNEAELRDALREQMVERISFDVQSAMRNQVINHLLTNVDVTLPAKLSNRQTERVVNRRAVSLLMRGMAREKIEASVGQLQQGAADEAIRELKTFFILQKVADENKVDVSEAELNGRIAMLAMQQGKRPERVKQEMAKDGQTLTNLYVQMREEKSIDEILKSAEIEEFEPTAEEAKPVDAGSSST